jgi:hypothetical protein
VDLLRMSRAASPAALVAARRALGLCLVTAAMVVTSVGAAQDPQTFTGVISDDQCAKDGHAAMRMGPTDAECTKICIVAHGAAFVLLDGSDVYALSDQKAPEPFAGQKVTVTGTLDPKTKTIRVTSIKAA